MYQISEQNGYDKNSFKDLDHGEMFLREFLQVNSLQFEPESHIIIEHYFWQNDILWPHILILNIS